MAEERGMSDQELLKLEYQECAAHSRFTVGHRFTYFVSFSTFFFLLIGAFNYVWITQQRVFGELKNYLLVMISGFGFLTVIIAILIERRNVQIFRTCDNRAAVIERRMGIGGVGGGIWQILTDPERRQRFLNIPVSHTVAISLFYTAVAIIWWLLIIFSIYQTLFA